MSGARIVVFDQYGDQFLLLAYRAAFRVFVLGVEVFAQGIELEARVIENLLRTGFRLLFFSQGIELQIAWGFVLTQNQLGFLPDCRHKVILSRAQRAYFLVSPRGFDSEGRRMFSLEGALELVLAGTRENFVELLVPHPK